jgi:hypothetical protein
VKIPRSSFEETVNSIVKDLDDATAALPHKNATEAGRATKGAAMALKSRVLLYAQRWADALQQPKRS